MVTVKHILRVKGTETLCADPTLPVRDALIRMAQDNVGSLLIIEDGKLVGLFAERDFTRAAAVKGERALDSVVADVMVREVLCVSPETAIEDCMALMTERRTRHLPVVDSNELVGIVSIGDVLKQLIDDREFTIQQLEQYIRGR